MMKKVMMKIMIVLLCIILGSFLILTASAEINILPSGSSSSTLEQNIDRYFEVNKASTASASIAVFDKNAILIKKAYGYADLKNKVKADDNTVYEWGSVTKLLTWVSVMQLVEQGKINLNEDITHYLPKNFLKKLKYSKPITMINLMNHNAGWQEVLAGLFVKDEKDVKNLGEALSEAEPDQVFEPGTVCSYSNWGAALAGYIVECVSGESFDTYVNDHIFKPLGMYHTGISPTLSDNEWVKEKRENLKCYDTKLHSMGTCRYYFPLYPAGSAVGTLDDIIKFAKALIPGDSGNTLLFRNQNTLNEMLSPTLCLGDADEVFNCHGFWIMKMKDDIAFHDGATVGCSTMLCIDPTAELGLVAMTNQSKNTTYTSGLLPMVFGKYRYVKNNVGIINDSKLSGYYITARTDFQGFLKFESILNVFYLKVQADKTLQGPGFTATPISSNTYVTNYKNLGELSLYTYVDKNGSVHLQLPSVNYIKQNTAMLFFQYLLLILLFIAILYSVVSVFYGLVRFIRRKIKKEKCSLITMQKLAYFIRCSIILIAIMFAILLRRLNSFAQMQELSWQIISICLLALAPIANIIVLLAQYTKLDCSNKVKHSLIINAIMGIFVTVNIYYWQMFRF